MKLGPTEAASDLADQLLANDLGGQQVHVGRLFWILELVGWSLPDDSDNSARLMKKRSPAEATAGTFAPRMSV